MFFNKKIIFIFVFIFSFILLSENVLAVGIGASPGSVSIANIMRGGYAEVLITVSNPGDEPINVRVGATGDIESWLSFDPERFSVDSKDAKQFKVMINPPGDQPNGVYEGMVLVVSEPSGTVAGTAGSITVSAIGIKLTAGISDIEIKEYKVERVFVVKTEECRPIEVLVWARNTGNVRVTPVFHVDLMDQSGATVIKTFDYTANEILPTRTEAISMKIPYEMQQYKCIPPGIYKVKVTAYLDGDVIFTETYTLEIVPRGTISMQGELLSLTAKSNATMGEIIKITGEFKNTGEVPIDSKLDCEVYSGGSLIGVFEGEELEVFVNEIEDLTAYFTPSLFGRHVIRCVASYSGRTSNAKEIYIDVSPSILIYILIIIIIIVVIIVLIMWKKKMSIFKR